MPLKKQAGPHIAPPAPRSMRKSSRPNQDLDKTRTALPSPFTGPDEGEVASLPGKSALHNKKMTFADGDETFSWRVFRIMAEFVDGFEFLSKLRRTVTIFGSARIKEDDPYYQKARELGRLLAREKFTVVTGGGPGIMEAANRGADEAGGLSVGLNTELDPHRSSSHPRNPALRVALLVSK